MARQTEEGLPGSGGNSKLTGNPQPSTYLQYPSHEDGLVVDFQVPQRLVTLQDLEGDPGVGRYGVVVKVQLDGALVHCKFSGRHSA